MVGSGLTGPDRRADTMPTNATMFVSNQKRVVRVKLLPENLSRDPFEINPFGTKIYTAVPA
jgi:hypothetical protein